jgi:hypothetical protein
MIQELIQPYAGFASVRRILAIGDLLFIWCGAERRATLPGQALGDVPWPAPSRRTKERHSSTIATSPGIPKTTSAISASSSLVMTWPLLVTV